MKTMTRLLCILLLLSGAVYAGVGSNAPRKYEPLDWKWKRSEIRDMKEDLDKVKDLGNGQYEIEGDSWIIRTYHTPRFTVQVSKYMDMFADIFFKAFLFKSERAIKNQKPIMTVYPSRESYYRSGGMPNSAGLFRYSYRSIDGKSFSFTLDLLTFYESKEKEPSFDKEAPLGTIQHEATHCLMQCLFGARQIPVWLNEGSAQYYEAWDLRQRISKNGNSSSDTKARKVRRKHSDSLKTLQYMTKQRGGELPRLDYLTGLVTQNDWNIDNLGEKTIYHYCIAESFIDYLMNSRKLRPFLFTIMQRLYNNELPVITPEEQLEHEKEWLMFLESHWGARFNRGEIRDRVKELKKRASQKK